MTSRSIALMVLFAIHCVKSQEYINTDEYLRGLIQRRTKNITAGNTVCRTNEICRFHQQADYMWCHTDYSNNWDYCCTGDCGYNDARNYLWCPSGSRWQYCGNDRTRDVYGRFCLETFKCGVHKEDLRDGDYYFWCYVDLNKNWGLCCAPHSPCKKRFSSSPWCYISASKLGRSWQRCQPEEP
ncbi:hypothetical protein CHS0354_003867 [Potamilus streckersoni]|uniref:Uncharacterized protein n=1 Tax=Potamilus streckersoni TaxID=2493646 RepID=A0AAE0SGW0_9BIVA|nr:hypothetical protein CHS0354_003867 [Potamilus streckersoni]